MLVLSRKVGERIVIGPNIVVTVVTVQGGRVKLGISAPSDIAIQRQEIRCRAVPAELARPEPWRADVSRYFAEFA